MPRPRPADSAAAAGAAPPPSPPPCPQPCRRAHRAPRRVAGSVSSLLALLLLAPSASAMAPRFAVTAEGRKLFGGYRIVPQPCKSHADARHGVCMFNYECVQRAGDVVGACMDGFLFGACCHLPPGSLLPIESSLEPVKDAFPAPSTVGSGGNDIITLVSTDKPVKTSTASNVHFVSTRLPLKPTRPTPPTFSPLKRTTPKPPLIADDKLDNTASISHILNLLNDSASSETNPKPGFQLVSTSATGRPEPSLSTWVSVNGRPTHQHSATTQKYPTTVSIGAQGPGFIVTMNSEFRPQQPLTPRPTPSAAAPTVIVLGPFENGLPSSQEVLSRPPGVLRPGEQAVVDEEESTTEPEFVTPTFDDTDFGNKMHVFVNKIVNSLAGDFQNLEDVVLSNKNLSISAAGSTTTAPSVTSRKPTRKPATSPTTAKPTRKPTTAAPLVTAAIEAEPSSDVDFKTQCGVRPLVKIKNGRIVGGKGAHFGEYPWQVLVRESTWLGLFTKNKCGGVLITNKYVITAAHCQPGFLASLVAVFGELDISNEYETRVPVVKNVRRVIVHRLYEPATFENDIALLELESPVTFDKHIVPICLPDDSAEFTHQMATVSGWGRLKYGGGVPSVLQVVQVPVIENNVCQEMFHTAGHAKTILPSFLCAGYANGQKDSCEGDSGGPLMVEKDGRWVLVGTVSHGIKCAAPYLPGVYMRTTFYKPWIKTITGAT